jgi:hypothetical protein
MAFPAAEAVALRSIPIMRSGRCGRRSYEHSEAVD